MNNNTKKYFLQRLSSVVPFISTFVIVFITMFDLKKKNASLKFWVIFYAGTAALFLLCSIICNIPFIQQTPIVCYIIAALIMTALNFLYVELQINATQFCTTPSHNLKLNLKHPAFIISTSVLAGILLTVVAAVALVNFFATVESMKYEDSNGPDDVSLYYITKEELITSTGPYACYMTSSGGSGNRTDTEERFASYDYDQTSIRSKRIDGICILQATNTKNDVLQLEITSTLAAGNAEIIITIDGEYYSHVPVNTTQTIILEDIAGKLVIVKGGFEAAQFEIELTRSFPLS